MNSDAALLWAGGGILALAVTGMAYFMLTPEEASQSRPQRSKGDSTDKGRGGSGKGTPSGPTDEGRRRPVPAPADPEESPVSSWVPASSRESTPGSSMPSEARPSKDCRPSANLIDVAKEIAVGFEREMRQATAVSDAEEVQVGAKLEREIPTSPEFRGKWDPPAETRRFGKYLTQLVDHIAKHRTRKSLKYRVHMVKDERFNAFALPGGLLAVHTGLLEGPHAVRDEAELALVLGHEIAHVELRHTMAAYQYARILLGDAANAGQIVTRMMTMPIQSKYEEEADRRGGSIGALSGYNPMAAARLWRRMAQQSPATAAAALGEILGTPDDLLGSHPPPHARCFLATTTAATLRPRLFGVRLYDGATSLRQRTPGFVQVH